mmetsp:Transcript_13306/g.36006  ORF Transcript_13306/g.36006 Transcript_13306/m.36006 type:complete len:264 (+) Transcript_13306:900-1691(+)
MRAAISSANVAIPALQLSLLWLASSSAFSAAFFLSSAASNSTAQYSFFVSSSTCSFCNISTMSSISLSTFVNSTFLPDSAKAMRSILARCRSAACRRALLTADCALRRMAFELTWICTKLLALADGRVFLKSSSASSSLRVLIVSEIASSSSLRVFCLSAHSADLVEQPFSSSFANAWSSVRESAVSAKSAFISTTATLSSPIFLVLDSMEDVSASSSLFLATIRLSYVLMASFSCSVASARFFSMVSPICLRIPTICPLAGA